MNRIDDVHWVDFVRGLAEPQTEQEIREQLAAGTGEEEARRWRRVEELGRRELAREVPHEGDFVRIVKAMGSLERGEESEPQARPPERLPAKLVFSSADQLAPLGARSHETPARHLVFETEEFVLDVRLERPPGEARPGSPPGGVLSGQILRQVGDPQPVSRAPVVIFAGDEVVGSTRCDDSGEFHAENVPAADLRICLLVAREACIEVPL